MPAEWEPLRRIWVCCPTNPQTWPDGLLPAARRQWHAWVAALREVVEVVDLTQVLPGSQHPEDAWVRDYGPVFCVDNGRTVAHNFRFDTWGGKYPPWDRSDAVPRRLAAWSESQPQEAPWLLRDHPMTLEGGSIESNGSGTLLTTSACLLHPSRNPHLNQSELEAVLQAELGVERVVWLPGGMAGDDTDGHQDDVARWLSPTLVAAVLPEDPHHPDAEALRANWQTLADAGLERVALPPVDPLLVRNPHTPGEPLPASHANWVIAQDTLFLPVFGGASDDLAAERLAAAAPRLRVRPVRCEHLLPGLGGLHCLSCHQPAVDPGPVPGPAASAAGVG